MADTGIMLSTLWAQDGIFDFQGNSTVTYNYYCPIYPDSGRQSVTGCSNTAAAQVLHYYIEKHGLILQLRLTVEDEYISNKSSAAPDIAIKADGSTPGTASFSTINNLLTNYSITSPQASAALTYACGVVQESNYTSTTTSTAWNLDLFKRAGFEAMTSVFVNDQTKYYWGSKGNISADAFEVLIENLTAGKVVIAGYPGHDVVIDGYNSSTDKFHINFGWGASAPETRWYTRSEINQTGYEFFLYDLEINGSYQVTVSDNAVYGTGTLLRAVENIEGTAGDNQIVFASSTSGKQVELQDKIIFTDAVTRVTDCNLSIIVTDSKSSSAQNFLWMGENNNSSYFENFNGDVIINSNRATQAAFYYYNAKKLSVQTNGALIFAGSYLSGGSYSNGAKTILASMQSSSSSNGELAAFVSDAVAGYSFYGSNGDDEIVLANRSIAAGDIQFLSGSDTLRLQSNSRLYGDIFPSTGGSQKIVIDSTSALYGTINAASEVLLDLDGSGNSRAMMTTINSNDVFQKCNLTADIFDASAGTFTLLTVTGNSYSLGNIAVNITGSGISDFALCVNATSENDLAKLFVENNSLKLTIKGKNSGDKTAPILNQSLSASIYRDKAQLSWLASSDNIKVQGYQLRYGQSSSLSSASIIRVDDLKYTLSALAVGNYYWQIRAFDANNNYSEWSAVQNFKVKEDKADLTIGNFSLSKLDVLSNQNVVLSFSVKNIGTRRSDAVRIGVYAGVTKLGDVFVSQIMPDGTQNCTFTIAAGKLAAGSHNIQAVIDPANTLAESDESNNRKNQFIKVTTAAADLYVKSFTVSAASIYTYDSLKLTMQIANAGNIASGTARIGIYDGPSTKIGEVSIGAVAADGTATCTYTIAAGKLAAGTHKFYAVTDLGNVVKESNENNNQKSLSVTVKRPEAPADLYVKSFAVSAASIYTYDSLKLTIQVANGGKNISAATKIGIYDGPSKKIGEVILATIFPNGTATCTYTINAGKLMAGTHKFYAVTDLGNAVKESNESNNQKSLSVTVKSPTGQADLYVKSFTVSAASVTTANAVTLTLQIANGGKNVSAATKIGIYDGPSKKIGEVTLAPIYPGSTATCTYTIAAGKLAVGTHKIYAVTDLGNAVKESNENNNQKSVNLNVSKPAALPDLYVMSFYANASSVSTANSVKLTMQIGNAGAADSKATKIGIYDGPSTKIGEVAITAIPAKGYRTFTFDIPAGKLALGTHKIYAVTDLGNAIKESNENNNQKSLSINITKPTAPDICVKTLTTPASVVSTSDDVTLTFQVHNIGNAAAPSTRMGIYDGASKKIGEISIDSLYASGYKTYTYTIAAGKLAVGTHKIYTVADLGNAVKESNENNNQNSISLEVKQIAKLPDLHFKKVVLSNTTVSQEKSVELFLTVENLGNVLAESGKISIYDGSSKLGEVVISNIYATGYKTYQFSINGSKLTEGSHTITAVIDAANTLTELDENNNRSSFNLQVTAPSRDLYMNYVKRLAAPAGAVKVAFSFGNSGNTATGACTASIWVSGNKVGEVAIGEFAPGQYDTYVYTIEKGVLPEGSHNIIVVLDPANKVKESNEDNNRSSVLIDLYDPYFVLTESAEPPCAGAPLDLNSWQTETTPAEMLSQTTADESLSTAGLSSFNNTESNLLSGNAANDPNTDIEENNKYALLA